MFPFFIPSFSFLTSINHFAFVVTNDDILIYKQKVIDFNNIFKNHTSNYNVLCLIHVEGVNEQPSHILHTLDNINIIILNSSSVNIGTKFENNDDNKYLDKIIKNLYNFDLV